MATSRGPSTRRSCAESSGFAAPSSRSSKSAIFKSSMNRPRGSRAIASIPTVWIGGESAACAASSPC
ncbi:MAG: hypothetical protein DMF98_28415 [Acidobacteria bacterium]|nr:MAG: hypothetical protein DMF98_28415 [Acidobacteriota bacterium]